MQPDQVISFWFDAAHQAFWFKQNHDFDAKIRQQFAQMHAAACAGELWSWRMGSQDRCGGRAEGRLAEIIVLDQFSRNLYRNHALAFAADATALVLSQEAILCGDDLKLTPAQRSFLYMPFMHSESAVIQAESLRLFALLGRPTNLEFAQRHADIISRFGRYPHRNAVLGRRSSAEELAFLQQPNSHF